MPNFYQFERILIACLIGSLSSSAAAREMYALPLAQKVRLVKDKSENDIASFLGRCKRALYARFPANSEFHSASNNMMGNDIYESVTDTHVEIKSGTSMTDANCGLQIVAWALDDAGGFIRKNMTEGMRERRRIFAAGGSFDAVERSKSAQMDSLSNFLAQQTRDGVGMKLSHFLKCVSRGITKGKIIKSGFSGSVPFNFPLKLMCDWKDGLVEYDKAFATDETLSIVETARTAERCHIIVTGERSNTRATIYPHHKNSFALGAGERTPANYWVQTACFHVWINRAS